MQEKILCENDRNNGELREADDMDSTCWNILKKWFEKTSNEIHREKKLNGTRSYRNYMERTKL